MSVSATCHPDKVNHALGLCSACYGRRLRRENPSYAAAQNQRGREWHAAHLDQVRIRRGTWYDTNRELKRQQNAVYYEVNREEIRKYRAERYRVGLGHRCHEPQVQAAHQAVAYAIARGFLTRQPCEVCGGIRVVAHHSDYGQPLSVTWLCRRHHKEEHDRMKEVPMSDKAPVDGTSGGKA